MTSKSQLLKVLYSGQEVRDNRPGHIGALSLVRLHHYDAQDAPLWEPLESHLELDRACC